MAQRTTAAVAILAGALLAAAGCDANTGGSNTPETSTDAAAATEALWDPCTQIGDDVLQQVGVDPTTQDNTISGVEDVEGWKHCSWKNKASRWDYTLGVWSTTHTIEEIKDDPNNIDLSDASSAGRSASQFRKAHDSHDEACYLAVPAEAQTIEISAYKTFTTVAPSDERSPCEIATEAAGVLAPTLPE